MHASTGPHSASCMANGGVYNMNFGYSKNTPAVLRVAWSPNCSIPYHYHPTGAMYFVLYGSMYFKGDLPWGEIGFGRGDTRWVQPGFSYVNVCVHVRGTSVRVRVTVFVSVYLCI